MARQPKPHQVTGTRWQKDGQRVPSSTPGAQAVPFTSETYYAKVNGKRVSLGTSDYLEACTNLKRLLEDGPDPQQAHKRRPLEEHIQAFAAHLKARGITPRRLAQVLHDVRWLARQAGWDKLPSLSAEGLERALAALEGHAAGTRRGYRQRIGQFARWLVRTGRLPRDPFLGVQGPPPGGERRYLHRCPTEDELRQLFEHLHGPRARKRCRLTGPQRAMGYRVCLGTGFRANELRSLRRQSFDLDRGTATLAAPSEKNRKGAVQPLPAWLVAQLRDYFASGGPTWESLPAKDPGPRVLDPDLRAAGIPPTLPGPEAPLLFSFHSFRVHFIDGLCRDPGNSLKTVMALARHSDARLTLQIYARYHESDAREALGRLPPPGTTRE